MALIRRVSRLFAADMHAVLDQIEEPEVVLRQAIREMEEELARQRQRAKWLGDEIDAATGQAENLRAAVADIDANLDLCFRENNEALAKKLTRRKLETVKLGEQTQARQLALLKQRDEIAALIAANAEQLESLQQKAAVLAAEPGDGNGAVGRRHPIVDEDDVEIAFLREKQARMAS
jgi:phage shock protein A